MSWSWLICPRIAGVREAVAAAGARLLPAALFVGLQSIEMAFFKLKALLGKAAARTLPDLWRAIAERRTKFTSSKCRNFFVTAGYDPD
jgi:hypothetical protein